MINGRIVRLNHIFDSSDLAIIALLPNETKEKYHKFLQGGKPPYTSLLNRGI